MADVVIRAEGLGKKFLIGHQAQGERYTALRDVVARGGRNALRKVRDMLAGRPIVQGDLLEEVWALRDVNFEVRRGEVMGIIGRNGAGKSTLLKILSRISEPSEGRVAIRGRVASLLEVGTGFHPELSGRENILLNGAILGMSRAEVRSKLEEIVAFAGVERYLDTPVKRYSSGMYVRLAFAVAAHLESDILIVDEVLAVGDAEFQRRCAGKMSEVANGGRTILMVSHNMGVIQALCKRAILLDGGRVAIDGDSRNCIKDYLDFGHSGQEFVRRSRSGGPVFVSRVTISFPGGLDRPRAFVELDIQSDSARDVSVDLRLAEVAGLAVGYGSLGTLAHEDLVSLNVGSNKIYFSFLIDQLAKGEYTIGLDITVPFREYLDRLERCVTFSVSPSIRDGAVLLIEQQWGYGSLAIPLRREATASN